MESGEIAVPTHAGKRSGVALPSYAGQARHVEGVERQVGFFLSPQSSALITYLLALNLEPGTSETFIYFPCRLNTSGLTR